MLAGLWDDHFATLTTLTGRQCDTSDALLDIFTSRKGEKKGPGSWLGCSKLLNKCTVRRHVESQLIPEFCFLRSAFPICRHFSGSVTSHRVICASWLVGFQWEFPSYEVQTRKGTGTAPRLFLKCCVSRRRWFYLRRKSHPSFSRERQWLCWGGSFLFTYVFSAVFSIFLLR